MLTLNQNELQALVERVNNLRHFEAAPIVNVLRNAQVRAAREAQMAAMKEKAASDAAQTAVDSPIIPAVRRRGRKPAKA